MYTSLMAAMNSSGEVRKAAYPTQACECPSLMGSVALCRPPLSLAPCRTAERGGVYVYMREQN